MKDILGCYQVEACMYLLHRKEAKIAEQLLQGLKVKRVVLAGWYLIAVRT
jgi:hypothetical protein